MSAVVKARVLTPGSARGRTLVLSEPLSFWVGFDPITGTIIDQHHPQAGSAVKDQILVLPAARGSGGTPACIAESLRRKVGPAGVILKAADINIATGTLVAKTLYDTNCPVACVTPQDYEILCLADVISIEPDGTIITT